MPFCCRKQAAAFKGPAHATGSTVLDQQQQQQQAIGRRGITWSSGLTTRPLERQAAFCTALLPVQVLQTQAQQVRLVVVWLVTGHPQCN